MRRALLLILLSTALLGLAWYGGKNKPFIGLPDTWGNPGEFEGQQIYVGIEARLVEVGDSTFVVEQGGRRYIVRGRLKGARRGEFVEMVVVFHENQPLELVRGRIHTGRRWKIAVSVVPLLIVVSLLLRDYRFDWRRFALVRRTHA